MNERQFYFAIEDWQNRPYSFVDANCCQFAADIARCWDVDIKVPDFDTTEQAAKWIKKHGAKSLYHYLVKLFGKPVAPLQAKRGFIAYRKGFGLEGSAIGAIERKALFVGDKGLIEIPLGECSGAFDPSKYHR